MKVVSIDIETTGLDPQKCDILQIGACIFDLLEPFERVKCPKLLLYVNTLLTHWEQQAVVSNAKIVADMMQRKMRNDPDVVTYADVVPDFRYWLNTNGVRQDIGFTVTGKNFMGFDQQFLCSKVPNWADGIRIKHRSIDIASHFWQPGDAALPTLQMCLERAGINTVVSHTALDDALDVAELTHMALSPKS